MSQAIRDPLQFAEEESLGSQVSGNLGTEGYGNSASSSKIEQKPQPQNSLVFDEPLEQDEVPSAPPLYPQVAPLTAPSLYPSVSPLHEGQSSMRRTYDRSDTMYSQNIALSEDNSDIYSIDRRDSDLADYPEGPAVSLAESHVHIQVSDPMKMVGPSLIPGVTEPYMTYLVTTKCSLSSFMPAQTSVRRRFKDYVALANLLKNSHRGYFIPPRPEKNAVQGKKMDARFVEYRRRALERYLNVLGVHSVIGKSEEFKTFLSLEGDLRTNPRWQRLYPSQSSWVDGIYKLVRQMIGQEKAIPQPGEATQSARKTHDLVRMIKEGLQLYNNRQQGGGQYGGEELELRSSRILVEEARRQLTETVKKSEGFSKRFKRYINIHGSLGIILTEMGKYEQEQKYHTDDRSRVIGEACSRVYKVGSKAQEDSKHQLQLFYHYRHLMPAVLEGLAAREGCLLTLETLQTGIANKKSKAEELQSPGNIPYEQRQRRLANIQGDLDALKEATASASAEYERIKSRNQQDMVQLQNQKQREFLEMLTKFTEIQVGYWTTVEQTWKRVGVDLGASELDFEKGNVGARRRKL